MKKLISLFTAVALLFAATSCSSGSSDSDYLPLPGVIPNAGAGNGNGTGTGAAAGTGTGANSANNGIRIGDYTLDFDDGDAIALYLTSSSRYEAYKMCFYSDKTVKVRVTPVMDMKKTKGKRYDFMIGTYEGNPTVDGKVNISFTKKLDDGYLLMLGTEKYRDYDGIVPYEAEIKEGKFEFSEKPFSFKDEYVKTTKADLGQYNYQYTDRENVNATEIIVPEGYSKIANYAFSNNTKLAKITIPSTMKEIQNVFYYGLKDLEVKYNGTKEDWGKVKVNDSAFDTARIICTDGELLGQYNYKGNFDETEIVVPEGYSKIANYAFSNITKLAKITIPSTMKEIQNVFYYGLKNLEVKYNGTKENWKKLKVYDSAFETARIICTDGELKYSSTEYDSKRYMTFKDK